MRQPFPLVIASVVLFFGMLAPPAAPQSTEPDETQENTTPIPPDLIAPHVDPIDPLAIAGFTPQQLTRPVRNAFAATHTGLSTDALLADDTLLHAFDQNVQQALTESDISPVSQNPNASTFACRWMLLRLRKSSQLNVPTTQRVLSNPDAPPRDTYAPIAEIAARLTLDRFGGSLDAMLCDPPRRQHFDTEAARLLALSHNDTFKNVTPTLLRATALALRKARRLRPELTARIADWDRTITTHRAIDLQNNPTLIPRVPGVYLFRDAQGYLYIGEAKNLRTRLTQHLSGEGQPALTAHLGGADLATITLELHAFAPNSNARLASHRRAYESELIATRHPRFNVRP